MHSRTIPKKQLALSAFLVACNGRVVIGTEQSTSGGASGEAAVAMTGGAGAGGDAPMMGGQNSKGGDVNGGSTSVAGGNAGSPTQGGTAGVAEAGAAGEAATGPRWLEITTESSLGSTVTFQNLADPSSELLTVDDRAGCAFSPDGNFACLTRRVDSDTIEMFLIDASSSELGAPRSLGRLGLSTGCFWSPDSTRLFCLENVTGTPEAHLFEPASGAPLARVSLGPSQSNPTWASDGDLFFTDEAGELVRVEWSRDGRARTVRTGLRGVLTQLSPERDIALLTPLDAQSGEPNELLDLVTLAHAPLDLRGGWQISPSFRSLVSVEIDPMFDVPATFSYYSLDGISAELVETRQLAVSSDDRAHQTVWMRFAGERFLELHDGRLFLTSIAPGAVSAEEVPGNYRDISSLVASADGRWITFRVRDVAAGDTQPVSRWLIRLDHTGIRSVIELGRFTTVVDASFSPDSSKLILFGSDSDRESGTDREPPVLFGLGEPGDVTRRTLDLPYDWAAGVWSSDSSYLAFFGGAIATTTQLLYVVDVLDPGQAPRLIVSCSSNPALGPACPSYFALQR